VPLKIVFAIPFFKGLPHLETAMKSVVAQNSKYWRGVILDDSIDSAESVGAQALAVHYGFEYLKNSENLGMAKNWNQALTLSDVELVTLLHSDDCLAPHYTEAVLEAAKKHPETTAFFCKTQIIDENGKPQFSFADWYKTLLLPHSQSGEIELKGVEGIASLIPGNFVFCPTLCFRPKFLGKIQFDPRFKMVLDLDLIFRILLSGGTLIGLYSEPLYFYRRHSENATEHLTQSLVRFREEVALYSELSERLSALGHPELAKKAQRLDIVKKNLAFRMVMAFVNGQWAKALNYGRYWFSLVFCRGPHL